MMNMNIDVEKKKTNFVKAIEFFFVLNKKK